jgi:translation elongation factor EF-4
LSNPAELPDPTKREWLAEPYVRLEIITPEEYVGPLMELAQVCMCMLVFKAAALASMCYCMQDVIIKLYRNSPLLCLLRFAPSPRSS